MIRPVFTLLLCLSLPCLLLSQTDTVATVKADTTLPEIETPGLSGSWKVVVAGGWTFPFDPTGFDNHFKTNYNVGGGISYALPPGEAGYGEVSLLIHYYNMLFTRSGFREANNIPTNVEIYGYPGDIYTGMVQFRGVLGSPNSIAPFFTTAIGFYHIALPEMGRVNPHVVLYEEYKKYTFGWSVGLGLDVPLSDRLTLFGEGKAVIGVTETNGHKIIAAGGGVRIGI